MMYSTVLQDISYAMRLLAKKPSFTILTTLVMAAGIGLSVFMFSFLNTILFKDLPFTDGGSLVIFSGSENGYHNQNRLNSHDYFEIKKQLQGVSEFSLYYDTAVNVAGNDGARRYKAILIAPNFFELTRTPPILGREFSDAENQPGTEAITLISFDLWKNIYAGDKNIIGKLILINGVNHEIIGVMPQGYAFPDSADLWLPIKQHPTQLTRGQAEPIYGLAHLDEGTSIEDVNRQLDLIMQRIEQNYPQTNHGIGAYITSIPWANVQDGDVIIYTMLIVALLVFILASINVGNLLLSRAVERRKETAIRVALGAPRSRLISQMLWESIIICSLGGLIGLLVMAWGLQVTQKITATFFTDPLPFWWEFGLDNFTLSLFFLFVICSIVVTGLLPAWKNSAEDFNGVLRDGTRGATSKKSGRINKLLVMSEIFISMTVLISAVSLTVASYIERNINIGADTDNTIVAKVILSDTDYPTKASRVLFAKTLTSRLENSSNIGDVMISKKLPGFRADTALFEIEGKEYTQKNNEQYPKANNISTTIGSLKKLGVKLHHGRYFNSSDEGLEKYTAVITQSFAERHFGTQSSLGRRFRLISENGKPQDWLTIVGVVAHTAQGDDIYAKIPSVFRPYSQVPKGTISIAMRVQTDNSATIRQLRATLKSIDAQLPAYRIETYNQGIERMAAPLKFVSSLTLLCGLAAVILAGSGIYGVMSNTINQRTQEIGVKQALGADEDLIIKEFMTTGLKQLLWGGFPGVFAGCFLGFAILQLFNNGLSILIIITLSIIMFIGSIVMIATYLPTKRALKMEPSEALHYE
ncbi:MAG: ABC transporter permease [Colwellia sp.]|nr:ABC transporter permease [Colwellia sp.]